MMHAASSQRSLWPATIAVALVILATGPCLAVQVYQAQRVDDVSAVTGLSGELLTDFSGEDGKPAPVQTKAAVFFDANNIRFVVECLDPDMGNVPAKCTKDGTDVFADDCIELFISPAQDQDLYYHFATNLHGARFEEKVKNQPWTAPWTVKTSQGTDRWRVIATIPWAAIDGPPVTGSVWWFNVDRQRHRGDRLELSSWSATGANFHDVTSFAALVFDDKYSGYLQSTIIKPWDEKADDLRQRAKIDTDAEKKLAEALQAAEQTIKPVRTAAQTGKPVAAREFGALLDSGRLAAKQLEDAKGYLDGTIASREAAERMRKLAGPGQGVLVYSVPAVTDNQILPIPEPPGEMSDMISLRACRGEYEPGSFVVYSLDNSLRLELKASELSGLNGVIPASAVDVRAVKSWYQSGGFERFPINRGMRKMTPELLLYDDDLVRVDYENKENFVKLQFADGRKDWLWVSSPERTREERDTSVKAMPIRDARTLQPIMLPAREAKQVWVTVRVPDHARPGVYHGAIELWSMGNRLGAMKLRLQVLPFDLAPNPLESSVYFHWGITMDETDGGLVEYTKRTWDQYRAELENLLAHGVDNPTLGIRFSSPFMLRKALQLRKDVGLRMDHLYYLIQGVGTPDEQVREIIKIAREFGYEDVYFYGQDEARGDALRKQRERWEQIHELGGKVFVAGSAGHNFPDMGDVQDLLVCYGDPTKEEAANWHSKQHKIFCYANPQSGIEAPETYRRNYGLLLAANDYDGGMTYIYYHGWNDFSGTPYRQHNFIYPTTDGVIDTVQWEGYREGIDDLRYLGTLREAIARASKRGGTAARDAQQAQEFIDSMDVTGDLSELRSAMIEWILKLGGEG